jgi:hypothetical protein
LSTVRWDGDLVAMAGFAKVKARKPKQNRLWVNLKNLQA